MSFKEMIEADNQKVFLNLGEFAEKRTILYDGEVYDGIPIILTKIKEKERPIQAGEVQGLHNVSAVAHMSLNDMHGVIPEAKQHIRISDGIAMSKPFFRLYRIVTSDCEMGMIVLELEAIDE